MRLSRFAHPMLRLNGLKSGDVVLTRSCSTFASLNIAMQLSLTPTAGTRQLYSHAALVIAPPYDWFESQGYGIGPTRKKLDKTEMRIDGVYRLSHLDPTHFHSIEVLRHPVITALSFSRDDIPALINECALKYLGFSYPFVTELADAATILKHFPSLRDTTSKLFEQIVPSQRPMCPGPFCSELVVSIFEDLTEKLGVEVRVTRGSHEASAISPSDLAYPVLS